MVKVPTSGFISTVPIREEGIEIRDELLSGSAKGAIPFPRKRKVLYEEKGTGPYTVL